MNIIRICSMIRYTSHFVRDESKSNTFAVKRAIARLKAPPRYTRIVKISSHILDPGNL